MNSTITLPHDVPEQLVSVLQALIDNLQMRLDAPTAVIQIWLQNTEFLAWIKNEYQSRETTTLEKLANHPKLAEYREIYQNQLPLEVIVNRLGWSADECGHVIEKYDNGYTEFCPLRKCHHDTENHKYHSKTYQQILEQRIYNCTFSLYEEFLNELLVTLLNHFEEHLKTNYQVYRVALETSETVTKLNNWLKKHPTSFKSKQGLIDSINRREYIDVFVPNNNRIRIPVNHFLLKVN